MVANIPSELTAEIGRVRSQMQADQELMEQNPLRAIVAQPHDASCRCGACFHAAQDQRMAEASADLSLPIEQPRPWPTTAEHIAALRHNLYRWREYAEKADATIANLRALLAAQQAVIDAVDTPKSEYECRLCGFTDEMLPGDHWCPMCAEARGLDVLMGCNGFKNAPAEPSVSAFPFRALRGGDGMDPLR